MSQLVVATGCPSCGAPLDVSEGANAIRCGNCHSNLLVTGRKRVLSYYVPATVKAAAAHALAKSQHAVAQIVRADLFFIPYYRLTGHDFGWQGRAAEPAPDDDASRNALVALFRDEHAEGRALAASITVGRLSIQMAEPGPVQLVDRYVEKSFVARELRDFTGYSLGVRPQALRVGLVRPGTLAALGKAVGVSLDVEAAMTRGLMDGAAARIVHRAVLARILSVIYFPYWVVELEHGGESWLTLVDGVTESIAQARAPLSLRTALDVGPAAELPTAGFRPLVCPNCGWDLPVNADDVVFFCASCEKAWQLHGTEMTEVAHQIAAVAGVDGAVYLPFWQLAHSCVPAFRYRRLKALATLTTRLSAKPLRYEGFTGTRPQLRGCFYDAADAALLARFVAAGAGNASADEAGGATLVWLPFKRESQSLVDPFTGMGLQASLLL
jgi:LSD1 subclass zinc finger protein